MEGDGHHAPLDMLGLWGDPWWGRPVFARRFAPSALGGRGAPREGDDRTNPIHTVHSAAYAPVHTYEPMVLVWVALLLLVVGRSTPVRRCPALPLSPGMVRSAPAAARSVPSSRTSACGDGFRADIHWADGTVDRGETVHVTVDGEPFIGAFRVEVEGVSAPQG